MFANWIRPGSLAMRPRPICASSITWIVDSRPLHSRKNPSMIPRSSTRNRNALAGSALTAIAIDPPPQLSCLGELRAALPQTDTHDDEFGGVSQAHADLDRQAAERHLIWWVKRVVDTDVERFARRRAEQCAIAPH